MKHEIVVRRCKSALLAAGFTMLLGAELGHACGDLAHSIGPFDYRSPADKGRLKVVEDYHFLPQVEFLREGMSSAYIGGDLEFVLRQFPNHHRALRSVDMLGRKLKSERLPGMTWELECYFDRAIRWRKEDAMVRMLYGIYLGARERKKESIEQLRTAEQLGAKGANFHYNLGLAYFDAGQHDSALTHAKKAYDLGFPLPGLKEKLKRAGKWR